MDLTRNIIYRGYTLNDEEIGDATVGLGGIGEGLTGCVVDSADFSDVDIVQFTEKRSLQDGMDAGDVYKGMRRIRLSGTLYAQTRALLYDQLAELRAALDPVLAQREEPAEKGYQPLYFSVPTNRIEDYPEGAIDLRVLAMPRAFQAIIQRDLHGGEDTDALAIPWQATLVCKDPSIMGEENQDYEFTTNAVVTGATAATNDLITKASHGLTAGRRVRFSTLTGGVGLSTGTLYYVISSGLTTDAFKVSTTSGGSAVDITDAYEDVEYVASYSNAGNLVNRGNYLGVLNMLVVVGSGAGIISVVAGDSVFTITIPASTGDRIVRLKGADKQLTVEEDDSEVMQESYITFTGSSTWPLVPTGETAYTVTFSGLLVKDTSHMWFWETYS